MSRSTFLSGQHTCNGWQIREAPETSDLSGVQRGKPEVPTERESYKVCGRSGREDARNKNVSIVFPTGPPSSFVQLIDYLERNVHF